MADYLKARAHSRKLLFNFTTKLIVITVLDSFSGMSAHGKQDHLNQQLVNNISR